MKTPSVPALSALLVLLTFTWACRSPQTLSDTDRRTLQGMVRQADSFPDRAIRLADSAARFVPEGAPPDTLLYRLWMAKTMALYQMDSVTRAIRLLDSAAALAEADGQWAELGRISLASGRLMSAGKEIPITTRHDRVNYCREAVRAFDKADRRLEKAEALSLLGHFLPAIDPHWAVDTLVLAADILLEEKGSEAEYLSCAYRVAYHSNGLGKPDVIRTYLDRSLTMFRSTPDSPLLAPLMRVYAASQKGSRPDTALYYFEFADRLDPGIVDKLNYYREGLLEKSDLLIQKGRLAQAARDLEACLAFALSGKRWPMAARSEFKLGECTYLLGDKAASGKHYRNSLTIADTNASASFFRMTAMQRYLNYSMVMGDSSLARRLRGKLSSLDASTPSAQAAGAAQGVVTVVPPRQDRDILPGWLDRFLDMHPLLVRFLGFGLLIAIVGFFWMRTHAQSVRIKNFESYLRTLREGRAYRESMFAGSRDGSALATTNRKAWLMFRMEEWMLSEFPFRDPDFGVTETARHLGISPGELNEAVKAHVDVDAGNYLDHLRVEQSILLMKDATRKGQSMSVIAKSAGFKGVLPFNKVFRIVTEVPPGRYRSYCRSVAR